MRSLRIILFKDFRTSGSRPALREGQLTIWDAANLNGDGGGDEDENVIVAGKRYVVSLPPSLCLLLRSLEKGVLTV